MFMAMPRTVLVVDPDAALSRSVGAMIRACGYRALSAATAAAALDLARAHRAEIAGVLFEPAETGAQLPGILRQLRQLISGPLLLMSALGPSEIARQARRSTIAYLAKPFGLPELRGALTLIFGSQEHSGFSLVEEQAPASAAAPASALSPAAVSADELDALWAE